MIKLKTFDVSYEFFGVSVAKIKENKDILTEEQSEENDSSIVVLKNFNYKVG
jgi:hypothetical protein